MPKLHFASAKDPDMFYLVRRKITDPFLYVDTGEKKLVFLNALEIDAFNDQTANEDIEAVGVDALFSEARGLQVSGAPHHTMALAVCKKYDLLEQPIAVSKHLPLDLADFLRSHGAQLVVADAFLPERRRKSAIEIEHIRESVRRTCKAFGLIEGILRRSTVTGDTLEYLGSVLTSERLREEVDLLLHNEGMESPEGLIVSCGVHAAMPHHGGSGPIRPHQTIVCDIFPRDRENGYFADVSRTFVKGVPSKRVMEMYEAVKAAQEQATLAVKPGARAADVHAVAASVIAAAGFDVGEKGFIHSLGHGVGLQVHEAPGIGPLSSETLREGDVITIEPGLYYPRDGGIRLEDVVLVTADGYRNLTEYPRQVVI